MHELRTSPFTPELEAALELFKRDYDLHFAEQVPNLFDFVSQNSIRIGESQTLFEEDITAYLAEACLLGKVREEVSELPICTNRHLQPSRSLLDRCGIVGMPAVTWGHVPVLDMGVGILLAHYDPFAKIPQCFHPQNVQIVLCTLSTYRQLRDSFNERYQPPFTPLVIAPADPMPQEPALWAVWQLASHPYTDESKAMLEKIRQTESFEDAPPEWEYWFQGKSKGKACITLSITDFQHEPKCIQASVLKSMDSLVIFENERFLQIAHVLNLSLHNSLEAIIEQCSRQSRTVQRVEIMAADYTRMVEEQISRQVSLSTYIKKEDRIEDAIIDEIDPTQFAEDHPLDKDDLRIKKAAEFIIFSAHRRGASDILIEPQASDYRIRFTIDGMNVVFFSAIPKNYGTSIVAHLKVRASMSITERRLPQDGKITLQIAGKPLELRAATMPVRDSTIVQDEKMTLRLLSATVAFPSLDRLGMRQDHLILLRKVLNMANGIAIVTGPTGSGKTTTLYAAIQELDRERLNIVSLEDPIESYISGITQTQINVAIGLTFAVGLRAVLRQAPHVILVGEVRDAEIAQIAVQAANTGHLVLSTLHTNSALGTLARLQALGSEPHQIADAVRLIMSQRLIPKLCPVCRKSRKSTEMERIRIEKITGIQLKEQFYHANTAGCRSCHKGYGGRRILTEVIPIDAGIRDMLLHYRGDSLPTAEIGAHAAKYFKYSPLMTQAIELVNEGQVDLKDAQRLFLDFGE
jgi:general secretion pathway protein E